MAKPTRKFPGTITYPNTPTYLPDLRGGIALGEPDTAVDGANHVARHAQILALLDAMQEHIIGVTANDGNSLVSKITNLQAAVVALNNSSGSGGGGGVIAVGSSAVNNFVIQLADAGSVGGGNPALVTVQLRDPDGDIVNQPFNLAVRLADAANPYGPAVHGTLAIGAAPDTHLSATLLMTVTANQALVVRSDANGVITLAVNSSVVGDFLTLLFNQAYGGPLADYSQTFPVITNT